MRAKEVKLTLDIETANATEDALAYDVGFVAHYNDGTILERHSYIVKDIFTDMADLMQSAYYAHKIPEYLASLEKGDREIKSLYEVRKALHDVCKKYNVKTIMAYNAAFDTKGLNTTQRYVTKSAYRWFFPRGVKIECIWHMACQTICSQKKYYDFCMKNGFVSKSGNISTSAETVYRFLTNNPTFEEEHKGLEDVEIETAIYVACRNKKKKMNRNINRACWRIPQRKSAVYYQNKKGVKKWIKSIL